MSDTTPTDVVRAALATALPDDTVENRADLIVTALTQYGHLPTAEAGVSDAQAEAAARALAEASAHPRYTHTPDAWRTVLASAADTTLAYTAAVRACTAAEQEEYGLLRRRVDSWRSRRACQAEA